MLTAVRGTYDNGRIIWHEKPPVQEPTEVIVTFLDEEAVDALTPKRNRQGGSMKREVWMADDFNES